MGLFGVLTKINFRVSEKYLVQGVESVLERKESFFKDSDTLEKSFKECEYIHSVWFP